MEATANHHQKDSKETSSTIQDRFLSFKLGDEHYALPLLQVKEVIDLPDVTFVPQAPAFFLGIINLRGQVISVVDLRLKLGLPKNNSESKTAIICDFGSRVMGIVVDSVQSVLHPDPSELNTPPSTSAASQVSYVNCVYNNKDGTLVLMLDILKLFPDAPKKS